MEAARVASFCVVNNCVGGSSGAGRSPMGLVCVVIQLIGVNIFCSCCCVNRSLWCILVTAAILIGENDVYLLLAFGVCVSSMNNIFF